MPAVVVELLWIHGPPRVAAQDQSTFHPVFEKGCRRRRRRGTDRNRGSKLRSSGAAESSQGNPEADPVGDEHVGRSSVPHPRHPDDRVRAPRRDRFRAQAFAGSAGRDRRGRAPLLRRARRFPLRPLRRHPHRRRTPGLDDARGGEEGGAWPNPCSWPPATGPWAFPLAWALPTSAITSPRRTCGPPWPPTSSTGTATRRCTWTGAG